MHIETVNIKELNFELTFPDSMDDEPVLEIENDTSAVLVNVSYEKAWEIRELLTRYIDSLDLHRSRMTESNVTQL